MSSKRRRKLHRQEIVRRQAQSDVARNAQGPQSVRVERTYTEHYNGPLPHPTTLAQFEQIVPGSAQRLIANLEAEGQHRREMEKEDGLVGREGFKAQIRYRGRGQWMAFVITMAGLGCSALAMKTGHEVGGSILGIGSLVTIVTAFIRGAPVPKELEEDGEKKANS